VQLKHHKRLLFNKLQAIAEKHLSTTNEGKVRYELKNPYCDGTTHEIFEPVDFIAKLVARPTGSSPARIWLACPSKRGTIPTGHRLPG